MRDTIFSLSREPVDQTHSNGDASSHKIIPSNQNNRYKCGSFDSKNLIPISCQRDQYAQFPSSKETNRNCSCLHYFFDSEDK